MTPSERRLHPLSFIFGIGTHIKSYLLPGLAVLFLARTSTWQIWLMLLLIPYAIAALVRYLGFRYRFGDEELIIRSGLVFHNERHIPYGRIQNIGSVQGVLHRLFGVVEVKIETAGGQEPEASIQVLSVAAADEMRARIREVKRLGGQEAASPTLVHLSPADLLICGLVDNRGMVVVATLAGFAWELGWFGGGGWTIEMGPLWDAVDSLRARLPLLGGLVALVLAFLFFLICVRLLSIGWALVKLFDFKVVKAGKDLNISRGLLTRLRTTIPIQRIQVVTITEKLFHRAFERAEMRVDTAGGSPEEEKGGVSHQRIAPIIRKDALTGLLSQIMPGIDLGAVAWQPVEQGGWRRLAKIYLLICVPLMIGLVSIGGREWLLAAVVLAPGALINARMQVRHMGWALTDEMVLYRSGWLRLNVSIVRHGKIQALRLSESPIDRRCGMAALEVDTAGAGSSSHRIQIPYLSAATARVLYERLAVRAAGTTLRW